MDFKEICINGLDGKSGLNRWEGRTNFIYLDSRKVNGVPAPLVTVGVGCAIPLSEALTLPFKINGILATVKQIQEQYEAIQAQPPGRIAAFYSKFTTMRLDSADIDALVEKRFVSFIAALEKIFPVFNTWPEPPKAGTLDLIYETGAGGFLSFKNLIGSLRQTPSNFHLAATQCAVDPSITAYSERNITRTQLYLAT